MRCGGGHQVVAFFRAIHGDQNFLLAPVSNIKGTMHLLSNVARQCCCQCQVRHRTANQGKGQLATTNQRRANLLQGDRHQKHGC